MTFSGCTKLKTLPLAELFNSPGGLRASSFTSALANCPALTTAIPAYELVVGEETYKVYPWERGSYSGHSNAAIKAAAAAVFGTRTNVSGSDFATGSEKIPDWSTIPASWGGGDDGITAAPDLEVKITHPEKREYYTIVFDFFGKQVTNFVYYLGKAEDIKKYLPATATRSSRWYVPTAHASTPTITGAISTPSSTAKSEAASSTILQTPKPNTV